MVCDKCGKELGDTLEFQTILNEMIMFLYKKISTVKKPEQYAICAESLANIISIYNDL